MEKSLLAADSMLSTLVHIQTQLDCDLSLDALAKHAGFSPSHFHRVFRSVVGETPKQYTQRLRLERASIELCLYKTTVLETALACGFEITKRLPARSGGSLVKRRDRFVNSDFRGPVTDGEEIANSRKNYQLSSTKVVTLKTTEVAFIRHVGPYEDVPDTLWSELTRWAMQKGFDGRRVLMGICQDSPKVTPRSKLRFDAAMQVPESFSSEDRVGHQTNRRRTVCRHSSRGSVCIVSQRLPNDCPPTEKTEGLSTCRRPNDRTLSHNADQSGL